MLLFFFEHDDHDDHHDDYDDFLLLLLLLLVAFLVAYLSLDIMMPNPIGFVSKKKLVLVVDVVTVFWPMMMIMKNSSC